MYTLKGFAHIGALVDNTLGTVAPVGELSPFSRSYARELTEHVSSDASNVRLITFTSTTDGKRTRPADTLANVILSILNWVYTEAKTGSFSQDNAKFEQIFLNRWGTQLALLESGAMVQDGTLWAPGFIDFEFTDTATYGENRIKVWFANQAFESQYDDYEIDVIPPLENLETFFGDYNAVKSALSKITLTSILEKIEAKANRYPYTAATSDSFDWVDRSNPALTLSTDWTTVIYGAAGNTVDNKKAAIIDFVLANSKRSRDEWAAIFPDIFTATEFIITPMWNDYSVPNKVLETGLYASAVRVTDASATAKKTSKGTGYTDTFIDSVLCIASTAYKCLTLAIVGGPNNRGGVNIFSDQFEDYMGLPTTHGEFGRMSPETREFVVMLMDMIKYAEVLTPSSTVPLGYTRMSRNGVYYLVRTLRKVQYLVVSKYSLNDTALGFDDNLVDSTGVELMDDSAAALTS